jgi:threonine/homoserine/homoserine lactone efflux protein
MSHDMHLWLFFLVVSGVVILPGLDMAFVLGSALTGGRRRGGAAVAGIVAGGVCHVTMTAAGIGVLLKLVPVAFNALLIAGALYIAWIGLAIMRSGPAFSATPIAGATSWATTFRQGAVTSLLNPKAYLFMLAIFPQFLRPADGPLWSQATVLWLIIALTQVVIYGALALLADRARGWLESRPLAGRVAARGVGTLLLAAAMLTGLEGWRSL